MDAVELRRMLARINLTQEQLADLLEKNRRTVSRWALGEIPITRMAEIAIRAVVHHFEHGCPSPDTCRLGLDIHRVPSQHWQGMHIHKFIPWLMATSILIRAHYQYGDPLGYDSPFGIIYHWITQ